MSLLARIGLLLSLLLMLAMTLLGSLIFGELQQEMGRHTQAALDGSLRLLRQTLIEEGKSVLFHVKDGHLHVGEYAVSENDPSVDRVRAILGGTATIFLGDMRLATNILTPSGVRAIGTKLAPGIVYETVLGRGEVYGGEADILGKPYMTRYEPLRDPGGRVIGILYVGVARAEFFALIGALTEHMVEIGLAGTGFTVFILCAVLRAALSPLVGLNISMKRLVAGDLDAEIAESGRRDEIGAMTSAVKIFKDGLIRNRELEAETARIQADEHVHRRAALRAMADELERAVSGVVRTVRATSRELKDTATTLSKSAESTARRSADVAHSAAGASSDVAQSVGAAKKLETLVREIERQVAGSTQLGHAAAAEASQTTALVQDLSSAATRIGNVVALISAVASKTNLLALNATIEAARAGEAGRGFAVVANEVKALANQTASATAEIRQHIERIQGSTGHAVSAIDGIHGRIRQISDAAMAIDIAVEHQGTASAQIARHVAHAAAGTTEMTANIGEVARAAEETGAAATQVLASASELSQQSDHLSGEVDRFLQTIRAA